MPALFDLKHPKGIKGEKSLLTISVAMALLSGCGGGGGGSTTTTSEAPAAPTTPITTGHL